MNQDPQQHGPIATAEIEAAVAREARFKDLEAGLIQSRESMQHFVELWEIQNKAATHNQEEILSVAKEALREVKKTNGTVADLQLRVGQNSSQINDMRLDIDAQAGSMQAFEQRMNRLAGIIGDGAVEARTRIATLAWQWKILGAVIILIGFVLTTLTSGVSLYQAFK